jgi:hypothetical protein
MDQKKLRKSFGDGLTEPFAVIASIVFSQRRRQRTMTIFDCPNKERDNPMIIGTHAVSEAKNSLKR